MLPQGVKTGFFATGRLRRFSETQFGDIVHLLQRAQSNHPEITRVKIAQPESIPSGERLDFSKDDIRGRSLDLRSIRWGAKMGAKEVDPLTWFRNQQGLLGYVQSLFLDETLDLRTVFDRIETVIQQINFKSVSVYFPGEDGRWQRRLCPNVWVEGTGKYDGEGAIPTTTIKSVIEAKGPRSIVVDINDLATFKAAGIVPDEVSIANDLKNSHGPSEMIFIRVVSSQGKPLAVVQINNRVQIDREAPQTLFLPGVGKTRTLSVLNAIFSEVAKGIENAMRQEGITMPTEAEPVKAAAHPLTNYPVPLDFDLHQFTLSRSVAKDYLGYEIASLVYPAKLEPPLKRAIAEALDWMGRGVGDMLEHTVDVDEIRIAFYKGLPIAFASINSLLFVYESGNGKKHESAIIPLVGTAVMEDHRRVGHQVKLNHDLLVRKWWRQKFSKKFFKPLYVATRTRNPVVIHALYTHFKDVRFDNLTAEQTVARQRFADHLDCQVETNGIVYNAYPNALPEETDRVFKGRIKKKIDNARRDLGQNDARIFVFKYGLVQIIKTRLWLWWKKFRVNRRVKREQG